jgi:hypothetical protein
MGGSWKTIINDNEIGFVFDSLSEATLKCNGLTIGEEIFLMDGKKYYMKYNTNLSTKPYQLDLILFDYQTKKELRLCLLFLTLQTIVNYKYV